MAFKPPASLVFFVVILPVFVIGTVIGFFNSQKVEFNYLIGMVELPLIALLIAEFVLVALLTLAASFVRVFGLKSEIRRLRKQLRDSETELRNLRALSAPPAPVAPLSALPKVP
ncbi:LapA family protein [Solimonas sp. K1W22B-7]|uniref:LapA family protein n=1 Tax=Solimonas sp. K1W22B-7 TaxID=2303331 RepID=UPI001F0988F4|nr:LapA family protein [Solimonas sp. K1W22B-7]